MKHLNVVHLVDTEGPLYEPLNITFRRINEIFGLKIKPTKENLVKILNKNINLDISKSQKDKFYQAFNKNTLGLKKTWKEINDENAKIFTKKFRRNFLDSFGGAWRINWNCVDHVNYINNPQGRALGFHKIFDYYKNKISKAKINDSLYFHFHPVPLSNEANASGNHYFANSNNLFQILSRRIIDRNWFPSVYRPGFHVENPDSNWFLEQYIPFDYGNQSCDQFNANYERFENWVDAPKDWTPYHPSHDDYKKKGECRRWIARILNVGTRLAVINQKEVDKAFEQKKRGKKVILSFTNHDFRKMSNDFDHVFNMLKISSKKYNVKFKFSDAKEAFQETFNLKKTKFNFNIKFNKNKVYVKSNKKIFGPQPYLSIKTKKNKFFHENFYIKKPFVEWVYTFDRNSVPIENLDTFAFAANDSSGNTRIVKIKYKNSSPNIHQFSV